MEWEKHLLFRSNLNIELYETNTVSEELINLYNELGYENKGGRKDYFEFFYWVSKYLSINNNDYQVFESIVNKYETVNPISENDKQFILLSFKINQLTLKFKAHIGEESISLIDEAIRQCSELNIDDADTLLALKRLKLRYLLSDLGAMSEEKIVKIKQTKNDIEHLLVSVNSIDKSEEIVDINTIFLA